MENLFDEIEPRCGVLKFEDGQYGFGTHLSGISDCELHRE